MDSTTIWMIILAISVALPASILGTFLVLRRKVMIADAISHSVLPGIVVAYLVTKDLSGPQFLFGSIITAVFTSSVINWLQRKFNTQEDAAIGIVFTTFFAIGILLIALYTGKNTDIDQECVLYGDLETTVLYHLTAFGKDIGPLAFYTMLPLTLVIGLVIALFLPQWKAVLFDQGFANSKGLKANRWEWFLLLLVSIYSVLCFESVGVVMVVGLLVLPSSTALLISKRFSRVLWLSIIFSTISSIAGVILAIQFNLSIAPLIVSINSLNLIVFASFKAIISINNNKSSISRIQ